MPQAARETPAQQEATLRLFLLHARRAALIEDLKLLGVLPADFVPSPTFLPVLPPAAPVAVQLETSTPGHPAEPAHDTDGHELPPQADLGAAESDHKVSCAEAGTAVDVAQHATEGGAL